MKEEIVEGYRLSPQQEHLWSLGQALPHCCLHVQCAITIEGDLSAATLKAALNAVVQQHEILRTTFQYLPDAGSAVQVITDRNSLTFTEAELTDVPASEQEDVFDAFLAQARVPRALSTPLQATLISLSNSRHALLLTLPALCADVTTLKNLVPEIARAYAACAAGEALIEETTQFADLSTWQNELLESEETASGRAYWSQHELVALHNHQLPYEYQPNRARALELRSVTRQIDSETVARINALARECETNAQPVLLACWQILLFRLTMQPEITVGLTCDGRTYQELKTALGPLTKNLPLRAQLNGKMTIRDAVRQVTQEASELEKWQQYFTWQHYQDVGPGERYFPLCFEFCELNAAAAGAGLSFSLATCHTCTDRFKVKLTCVDQAERLVAQFNYDAGAFNAESIERLAGHYLTLLQDSALAPETRIGELSLLTDAERRHVLLVWNDTRADYPRDKCIHQLFEEQVHRRPDGIAVKQGKTHLSYAELNARSNQLARHLRRLGVKPGSRIGLFLEHSAETLIGILGVLKSGSAYVPFDPAHPKRRLAQIIDDAQLSLVLTQEPLVQLLSETGVGTLCLDSDWSWIAVESIEDLDVSTTPEDLAYVIYTSGSTGQPKGVEITQRALVNYVWWAAQVYVREEQLAFALYTSLAFDLTVTSIFTPLITGNRVVVYRGARRHSPLEEIIRDNQVEVLKLTPSHLALIKEMDNQGLRLKRLIVGGEALETKLAAAIVQRFGGDVEIFNEYGPTEATVGCMIHRFDPEADRRAAVPIGVPAANTRIYVLDERLEPVPEQVLGELYIAGDGLARGYLNRADVTRERFIVDPFVTGELMYRTGDLARRLASGVLEYAGRSDDQIKFHGYRIELNEIRTALNKHPLVRDSIVLPRENSRGDDVLVAYYVSRQEIEATELREVLHESIIEEAVPHVFVQLRRLPLTLNGKVDHSALPNLDEIGERIRGTQVAPRKATEELLASIWREVLGLERVGIHDNFFQLGGHSLLAAQVMSRVRETFQVELLLRVLFESPTIAGLAETIEAELRGGTAFQLPPLVPVSRTQDLPLSFAQQRLWLLDQLEPNTPFYNVPSSVRMKGQLNIRALEQTLTEIVRRHEALRTVFRIKNNQPLQVVMPAAPVTLPITDLSALPDEEREAEARRLATAEAQRPFDLANGPLLRASLLRLSETEHVVLFNMHHIVADGWSMGVLVREVVSLYPAFISRQPSPLPELPIQYADYAHWQREWLQGEILEAQLAYWRQQLAHAPKLLELPTDRPRNGAIVQQSGNKFFTLSPELSASLQELSRKEGVTLFITLLAAYQTLLHRYTGQDRIVVGTDFANRNRVETEALIGFFINILVMHTDMSGDPDFRDVLKRVREVALGAYAHQHLPFEKLVEAIRPDRRAGQTPLVQTLFVLQNTLNEELELPGLSLSPFEFESSTSKFDLAVFVTESGSGLQVRWTYNAALFDESTITGMWGNYQTVLESIASQPATRLSELKLTINDARHAGSIEGNQRRTTFKQFRGSGRTAVSLQQGDPVKIDRSPWGQPLSLVTPALEDLDLVEWASAHKEFLERELFRHGAVLLRDFSNQGVNGFERFAKSQCRELFGEYGDLPREGVSGKVYGSTPYPPDQAILFHNESSHLSRWPLKIWFYCQTAPQQGGETPIADCRKVYQLLEPSLREHFERKQLMYVRNYTAGLDVSWQDFFKTTDRAEVEAKCRSAGIEFKWREGDGLTTRQVRPAVATHPETGEKIFFNQIQLHHVSCLDAAVRTSLLTLFNEEDLPRNVYYGDGSPIEESVMAQVCEIYRQATVSFPWQEGDILMLDNMLVAHSRNPYVGPRKIVVAMGDMFVGA